MLNPELWKRLDALNASRKVEWLWVKGHAGHEHNEAVDRMAVAAGKGVIASGEPVPMPMPEPERSDVPGWMAGRAEAFRRRLEAEGHDALLPAFDAVFVRPA